jgi:general secretion pathway protein K
LANAFRAIARSERLLTFGKYRNSSFKSHFVPRLSPRSAAGSTGFILVAVLWILSALAALASVYAVYVTNTAMAARGYGFRLQAQALISAALDLTAYRLIGFDDSSRPTSGAFDFQVDRSSASVEFRSEGARVDLNVAPKELLAGLFVGLGAGPDDANSYADRIIAWRTKPAPGAVNPELDAYKEAGLTYGPRQAPFQSTAELRLVRDLPGQAVDAVLPFVTIFNGQPGVDVNTAAPEVIAALPHISAASVDQILKQRDPSNPQAVLPLLGLASSSAAIGARKAVRALVHITLETGRKVNADVVLLLAGEGAEPYRILAWRDDFDGPF